MPPVYLLFPCAVLGHGISFDDRVSSTKRFTGSFNPDSVHDYSHAPASWWQPIGMAMFAITACCSTIGPAVAREDG